MTLELTQEQKNKIISAYKELMKTLEDVKYTDITIKHHALIEEESYFWVTYKQNKVEEAIDLLYTLANSETIVFNDEDELPFAEAPKNTEWYPIVEEPATWTIETRDERTTDGTYDYPF